jgi:glycosyltransferase involved in cell wall biosynthesis
VATVHDVFSLVSDEFADERFRKKKIARYTDIAKRADIIICDSNSTRNDFLKHFPQAEPKIRVVYLGVDDKFSPQPSEEVQRVRRKYGIETDYVFYVGALSIRKNLLRMFEAFLHAREQLGGNLQFLAAGRLTYGKDQIVDFVRGRRCDGKILTPGYVAEEDLPALYSGAKAFLFATQYEGFGLPILEAAACGVPVVTSNLSSTAEIGEGIALLADPLSVEDIADALLEAIDSGSTVSGGPNAELPKRKWTDMAHDVLSIYDELARG